VVSAAQRLGALAGRRRGSLTVVGSLLGVGALVFVLTGRWGQFARAAAAAPWWELTAAAALQTASLVARSEAWNVCVHAAGGTVLGVLPVGPGVGAGAMVLILGAHGVAGVSAAGVLLTATGTLGALGYAGWALADRFWTARNANAAADAARPARALG